MTAPDSSSTSHPRGISPRHEPLAARISGESSPSYCTCLHTQHLLQLRQHQFYNDSQLCNSTDVLNKQRRPLRTCQDCGDPVDVENILLRVHK
jgi:hypothetical protein